jgi:hypothetical protein
MVFGHLGIIAGARSLARSPNSTAGFVALVAAGFLPDLVDVVLFVSGTCSPYGLYSHTVPSVLLQAVVVASLAWLLTSSPAVAALFAAVVVLHVPADYFTGSKLLLPGGDRLWGLRLYERPILDGLVEMPAILAGWWILRRTQNGPRWSRSRWLLGVILMAQLAVCVSRLVFADGIKPSVCFDQNETFSLRTKSS